MKDKFVEVAAAIYHFEQWLCLTDPAELKATFCELLEHSGFRVVSFTEHHFPVRGYTCVWLLAESHLAIHTFPADNQAFVQMSSCNEGKMKLFEKLLAHSLPFFTK